MPHIEKEIIVMNKKGLHARPTALFVQLMAKFDAVITVAKGEEKVDGKSIMGLLMLGAQHQAHLKVGVDGNDAEKAMAAIEMFFSKQEEELMP